MIHDAPLAAQFTQAVVKATGPGIRAAQNLLNGGKACRFVGKIADAAELGAEPGCIVKRLIDPVHEGTPGTVLRAVACHTGLRADGFEKRI